ncbi:hypothetical protein [Rhizocola hellebori]|uniref:hypothetical protein n=1 Tax=Rhizocola hellebori TaxID=1392758 RepID=UPI001943423D|nr:hypothetical protein [Rhizocola hellebori]
MRNALTRVCAVAALAIMALLGSGEAAFAASSNAVTYTDKTRAGEAWFNRSAASHGGHAWFDLYDAKCDNHEVYIEYITIQDGTVADQKTFYNDGGCTTTWGKNLDSGHFAIQYRVCVDDKWWPVVDTCSGWKYDTN